MRNAATLAVLLAAISFAVATAAASVAPAKPIIVTLHAIDGQRLGVPISARSFAGRIKPDLVVPTNNALGHGVLRVWKRANVTWGYTESSPVAPHFLLDVAYFGPFHTERGDTAGTPLAQFKKHWPGAKTYRAGTAWNVVPKGSDVLFAFNRSARLVGVRMGYSFTFMDGRNEQSGDYHNVCYYPQCEFDSSPYG